MSFIVPQRIKCDFASMLLALQMKISHVEDENLYSIVICVWVKTLKRYNYDESHDRKKRASDVQDEEPCVGFSLCTLIMCHVRMRSRAT